MDSDNSIRAEDRSSLWLIAGITIAIRAWFLLAHRIDSDEPQHLHVVWVWTRGLVQYRDVFDNHLPLLHVMFAPVMALVPESSAVFLLMRLAIAPVAIACAAMLFVLARPWFGARTAAIAALVFGVLPPWLPKSVEFRNDTLWMFFWLAGLALLARRRTAPFLAGVAFGLCLLASIKALPLLLAHVLAVAAQGSFSTPESRRRSFTMGIRLTLGAVLPLMVLIAWMYAVGALDAMVYDTLLFNVAAPVNAARRIAGAMAFAIVAAVIVESRRAESPWLRRFLAEDTAAAHLTLFAIWYVALLLCFWPILTPRDFLPLVPLAALAIAVRLPRERWATALSTVVLAATLASVVQARLWRESDGTREQFVDEAVSVTAKEDYVFDLKGDAVFRRRPASYIYEVVGRALTANGTIADRGPEEIAARRCCAAIRDSSHLPPRTRAFLNRYFVGDGLLRVCGTDVQGAAFEIAVPQTYAVVARDPSRVLIDGVPYRGPRVLAAGRHTVARGGNERITVIWWRAANEPALVRSVPRGTGDMVIASRND